MREHRNPRPRLAKLTSTDNPPRHRLTRKRMRAMFERLVRENPHLAHAVLEVLRILAEVDGPRAMERIEAVSAIVIHSPADLPEPEAA